jgi:hypothetical protein
MLSGLIQSRYEDNQSSNFQILASKIHFSRLFFSWNFKLKYYLAPTFIDSRILILYARNLMPTLRGTYTRESERR